MAVDHDEQKHYWENIARRRSPDHPVIRAFAEPKLAFILDALGGQEKLAMLEVGGGNGYFSHSFSAAFDLTCLDFSANMLAMNPLSADRKVVGDAERLPFPDRTYDVVFCGNLLHHLPHPARAVSEMRRVARRHVVMLEPNARNPLMFLFCLSKPEERGALKFSANYLRDLGLAAGMRLRRRATLGLVLPNRTPTALLPMFKAIDVPNLLGMYNICVFDV